MLRFVQTVLCFAQTMLHFVREILLRNVKCAAARGGFISFHFLRIRKFHNLRSKLFRIFRKANISLKPRHFSGLRFVE